MSLSSACEIGFSIPLFTDMVRSPLEPNLRPTILCVRFGHGAISVFHNSLLRPILGIVLAIGVIAVGGCTHQFGAYKYGRFEDCAYRRGLDENPSALTGEPHKTMDGIRSALDCPYRVIARKPKPESWAPTEAQTQTIVNYLEENDLEDVQVEFNYYSPRHRWRKLRENKGVAPVWKYTFGTIRWVNYTIAPGRVFGATRYDPYSNGLEVNNNRAYESLEEAAEAKIAHRLKYPGLFFSTVGITPVVNVLPEFWSSADIVEYARDRQDWPLEKKAIEGYYVDTALNATRIAMLSPNFVEGLAINLGCGMAGEVASIAYVSARQSERVRNGEAENEDLSKSVYADNDQPNEIGHLLWSDRR
jgi:hypothetical protein